MVSPGCGGILWWISERFLRTITGHIIFTSRGKKAPVVGDPGCAKA